MKKTLAFIVLLAMLLATLCSCIDTGSTQNQGNGNASDGGASNLGDYNVEIQSARLHRDFEGSPIIIVKYKFTNNDDEPASFWLTFDAAAFQDGIGLNRCYFADDEANYSEDNQDKEIKKGASISVEVAYKLNDTTTDVEIEVSESFSWSDKKITKIFNIK